jgi:hypothetical protein
VNAIDCFVELLAARLTLSQGSLPALAAKDAVYRADALFEAGADLSDALVAYDDGRVGSSTVRESALNVAGLACQLYLATTGAACCPEGLAEEVGACPEEVERGGEAGG